MLIAAGVLAGCSVERTIRETTVKGAPGRRPISFCPHPGCSLSIEDPATHEAVSIEVAAAGRVHAELIDALRAFRVDYRISMSLTTVVERD